MAKAYKAAIFDMDGTILDTIEDLTDSLNVSLARFGHRADYSTREMCAFFGSGALTAVTRALAAEAGWPEQDILKIGTPDQPDRPIAGRQAIQDVLGFYKPYYAAHCSIKTGPFPGVPHLLGLLLQRGVKTAVISNKPDPAVQTLCDDYFPGLFSYAAGEKAGVPRKPAPDMIFAALDALNVPPDETVYVGDSEIDIETARNAGLDCVCVAWGFRSEAFLAARGAERIVSSCLELADVLLL